MFSACEKNLQNYDTLKRCIDGQIRNITENLAPNVAISYLSIIFLICP